MASLIDYWRRITTPSQTNQSYHKVTCRWCGYVQSSKSFIVIYKHSHLGFTSPIIGCRYLIYETLETRHLDRKVHTSDTQYILIISRPANSSLILDSVAVSGNGDWLQAIRLSKALPSSETRPTSRCTSQNLHRAVSHCWSDTNQTSQLPTCLRVKCSILRLMSSIAAWRGTKKNFKQISSNARIVNTSVLRFCYA